MGNGRRELRALTRSDFDAVIRRASELAAADPAGSDAEFSEEEVIRIADEAGLPARHVRSALAEMRAGGRGEVGRASREGAPVRAGRVIERPRAELVAELQALLDSERRLRRVRRRDDLLHYLSASGRDRWVAATPRDGHVSVARAIEVRLETVDDGATEVEVRLEMASLSSRVLTTGLSLVAAAMVPVPATMALIAVGAPILTAFAAALALAALAGVGHAYVWTRWIRKVSARRHVAATIEVEGLLDGLEVPGRMEPPAPPWRRWLQRHFQGIARDLLHEDEKPPRRSGGRRSGSH